MKGHTGMSLSVKNWRKRMGFRHFLTSFTVQKGGEKDRAYKKLEVSVH